ncbi:MAG: hypothetical protein M3Z30_04380 [Gemmatimonadota bacterium]|nr:hypothetical protein [Gemmatimonadota bacterium]
MTTTLIHPTPSRQLIAGEQFRSVGVAIRKEGYLYLGALVILAILAIGAVARAIATHKVGNDMGLTFSTPGAFPMVILAILAPFAVWRSEDPSRRSYHWSMPVARGPHTLMKVASGWAWLMIAALCYLLFIVVLASVIPFIAGQPSRLGSTPAWEWLTLFTAPTLAYLAVSIAVIASDHAWRWIGGVCFGYWLMIAFLWVFGLREVSVNVHAITSGTYGLNAAFFGSISALAGGDMSGGMKPGMHNLSMSAWLVAMPLWLIGASIAVIIASYRHHE